jgi:hypothetical protein
VDARDRVIVDGVTCDLGGETLPVVNLSLGGFFVATERAPIPGQVVATRLRLPDGVVISTAGRVAWVNGVHNRVHQRLPPGCGIQNLKISFEDKLAIVAALRHFKLPLAPLRSATGPGAGH